ncbi:MAG TPA: hypothetical protein VK837_04260 [Longimicrobiales bacterium]|nr:hypothetical protein [Longimicrobiales bacterium]
MPKGPLQEFFAYVVQRPATDWQFAARLTCVDATGKRHDLGMIELSQANLAHLEACRSPDDDGR